MGLTIHWKLGLPARRDPAAALEALRQAAMDLPFVGVDEEVTTLDPASCLAAFPSEPVQHLLLLCSESVKQTDERYTSVLPAELHSFVVDPGPGCESGHFFLARYPNKGRPAWRSRSFCKTGKAPGHQSLVALLDRASEIGFHVRVHDESGFYESRSVVRPRR